MQQNKEIKLDTNMENELRAYEITVANRDLEIKELKDEVAKLNKLLIYHSELSENLRSKMNKYAGFNEDYRERIANLEKQLSQRKKNFIQRWLSI